MHNFERRFIRPEIRFDQGSKRIRGFIPYNSMSEDLGGFREIIAPTAFTRSMTDGTDIKALFNHDDTKPLARLSNGNLELLETLEGLDIAIDPVDTSYGNDARALVDSDLVDGMSFGFYTDEDSWAIVDGQSVRTLHSVRLLEVSIVFTPAYSGSSVDLRNLNQVPLEVRSRIIKQPMELLKAQQLLAEIKQQLS